jgi:hypothetical protein
LPGARAALQGIGNCRRSSRPDAPSVTIRVAPVGSRGFLPCLGSTSRAGGGHSSLKGPAEPDLLEWKPLPPHRIRPHATIAGAKVLQRGAYATDAFLESATGNVRRTNAPGSRIELSYTRVGVGNTYYCYPISVSVTSMADRILKAKISRGVTPQLRDSALILF